METVPAAKRLKLCNVGSGLTKERSLESVLKREDFSGPSAEGLAERGVRSSPFPFQSALLGFATSTKSLMCCDDMGLGKTFQMLALVRMQPPSVKFLQDSVRAGRYRGNTLVVVLKVTLEQWMAEYERHLESKCSAHRAVLFHGPKSKGISISDLCTCELVVTTYDCLRAASDSPAGCQLMSIQWWRVVLDEAHVIRNPNSRKFQVIDQLECVKRVALSGTPIHNKIEDLFPMLRFLRLAGFERSLSAALCHWKANYQARLEAGQKQQVKDAIKQVLVPCVIRRMKISMWFDHPIVANMTKKRFTVCSVQFKKHEDDLYACIEESCLRKAREVLRAGDSVKGTDDAAFGKLHALRLCCDVPQMCVDSRGRELYAGSECAACGCESVSLYGCGCTVCPDCTDSLEACPACGGRLGRGVPVEPSVTHHDPTPSSKLQALYKLLTDTPQEDKTIVFSNWIMVLDSIERHVMKRHLARFARVDGRTSGAERVRQLNTFRTDPECRVILMTLGAGGTGIDLREANRVIIVDPHWNPAIEAQACDRAYRIGQTKDVLVTRMVQTRKNGDETIEQVIRAIQYAKQRSMDEMFPKPPAVQVLQRLTK